VRWLPELEDVEDAPLDCEEVSPCKDDRVGVARSYRMLAFLAEGEVALEVERWVDAGFAKHPLRNGETSVFWFAASDSHQ
jgi:hypothetical protein